MTAHDPETNVSRIAAAMGEPARARMLFGLMDGQARTSTELAVIAGVSASTASVHLNRLKVQRLVKVVARGKHRYYSLEGSRVAAALEALSVLAGQPARTAVTMPPSRLTLARTCYDHLAGALGVSLHDRLLALGWLSARSRSSRDYTIGMEGERGFPALGIDLDATRRLRRRFASACLDWSERRPHLGGALGAALLEVALRRKWVIQDLDSRALTVTNTGRREFARQFGLDVS
jgi:DNA-binding transcriptional ArsR family regulator